MHGGRSGWKISGRRAGSSGGFVAQDRAPDLRACAREANSSLSASPNRTARSATGGADASLIASAPPRPLDPRTCHDVSELLALPALDSGAARSRPCAGVLSPLHRQAACRDADVQIAA